MEGSQPDSGSTATSAEYYLPATIQHSSETTLAEEFLTTVFRRRGKTYVKFRS